MTEPPDAATRQVPMPPASAGRGAAQDVDQRLSAWARGVLGDVDTSSEPPGQVRPEARCVGLYLMAFAPAASTRGSKAPPLQFCVRYLVTAWGPQRGASDDDLCELAFAAMAVPDFEVDFEPLPAAAWAAFGTAPRPAFSIRVPLRKARAQAPARFVRAPLVLAPAAMVPLQGSVLGPGDVPLAGARVELTSLGLATQTDHQGRFRFSGAPADRPLRLRVLARGATQEFETRAGADAAEPVRLQMNLA